MQDTRTAFLTKRELAVAKVKDAILVGRYRPGQALRQVQLMADLDLGATPAREAVLELLAKGLLVHESHRGMRVAGLDAARVRHVYSVRALLESEAARLSAGVATDAAIDRARRAVHSMKAALAGNDLKKLSAADGRFHQALGEDADNPVLLTLIEQMREQFPRYMLWRSPGRVTQSIREHEKILERFALRDGPGTAKAVRQHILNGLDAFDAILQTDRAR
jgi:DNA-binding GntR family transcriptional regulator